VTANEKADVSARPRRSVLYMPGSNARALEKGRTLPADALILDLEDSVAPDVKDVGRAQIADALNAGGFGHKEITVRINPLDTNWGIDDVEAMSKVPCDALVLPKVDSAQMVLDLSAKMDAAGAAADMGIWCMIETPQGVLDAHEIAAAHPRVGCLVMGLNDLAKDLRCRHTVDRLPFVFSLSKCVLAARAAVASVLDGAYMDLNDDDGFRASCEQGRDLGMDGKTLIHPKTIEMANDVFAPSADDIAWAERIIAAHAEALEAGKGVVVVDGKLIENLHVAEAERLIGLSNAINNAAA
jgi:citrate lyase subunit beta/citryl-CoA lyase